MSGGRIILRDVMARGGKPEPRSWPYDADYMRVTPTFREGSPGRVVCLSRGRKKRKERHTERQRTPGLLWMYYTAVTDGYVFPRGQSESPSFGRMDFILRYFRRLFITVVSYCCARQRSVKKGVRGFLAGLD